jgi:mono/diheme cytochrome c family protein
LTAGGDGPIAASLNPKPSNLAENQSGLSDSYLYWRIAEGGLFEPFRSGMPAWKGLLTEDQIWEVITYLRQVGAGEGTGSSP